MMLEYCKNNARDSLKNNVGDFPKMSIFALLGQYIQSLTLVVIRNNHVFTSYSDVPNFITRIKNNFYKPDDNFKLHRKESIIMVLKYLSSIKQKIF